MKLQDSHLYPLL